MNVKTIFIIDKKNNMLIFLGILDDSVKINQQTLTDILDSIVSKTTKLSLNSVELTEINNEKFLYGIFERIIIIIQIHDETASKDLLHEINKLFISKYSDVLDNYSDTDIPKFKSFLDVVKEFLPKYKTLKSEEKELVREPIPKKEAEVVLETIKPLSEDTIGEKPLLKPMKREAYPDGIPEYRKDEVLWEESQAVKNEYVAEFVEGMIFNLQIFISISLTHHYEVYIDFSEYPLKPIINIGKGLQSELGKNIGELMYYYKNWDTKIPPHIIEIVREFESVLMKFKALGKLSDTDEMPESSLPDLEPLPELPPLEEEPKESKEPEADNEINNSS